MKKYILLCLSVMLLIAGSCTKDNYKDYGLSVGKHDCSLLEYMEMPNHSYDWDSTVLMIYHAGEDVVRLFKGEDPAHQELTFFGPTNHSIRRYMLTKRIKKVTDLDPEWCKEKLLRHLIDGKIYRDDIPRGLPGTSGALVGTGGVTFTSLAGTHIWGYTTAEAYQGMPEAGPVSISLVSIETQKSLTVASANIEPLKCVVHSLHYNYTLDDM